MAQRDYKNSPTKKSAGGTLLGVVIGLVLGLIIAVAVAFYLNKGPKPFADRTGGGAPKTAPKGAAGDDPNKSLYGKDAKTGSAKGGNAGGADDKKDEKRFSFYEILPGKEEVLDARKAQEIAKGDSKAAPPVAPKADDGKSVAKGDAKTDDSKPAAKEQYFLQAGAFGSPGDADNQKAKLALMGFEAKVEAVEIDGKGTMHRVRIGPYGRLDDINRVRSTLATNGVDAALIKLKDPK
jgi:cell division protein FtsN